MHAYRSDPHPGAASAASGEAFALAGRVRRFIAAPAAAAFDALALAIYDFQSRTNAPYRRFVERTGVRPRHWTDIPAVPAEAFRDSVLACGPPVRVYESSGTTAGPERRARHHLCDLAVYRAAALSGFARAVLPDGERRRFVVAAPERASHDSSSLGEMVTWLRETRDVGGPPSFLSAAGLAVDALAAELDTLDPARPILLLAVTSALLTFVEHARGRDRPFRLPAGSIVLDTGGCKGYREDLRRAAVLERYHDWLGVDPDAVVNEYGMTELCSQLYARGAGAHHLPPWLRVLVYDPSTGREQSGGRPGLLRYVDLANVGSVIAVQTADLGRAVDGGIELLGRAPQSETRGCSLLLTS